jgi:hypothetical protein
MIVTNNIVTPIVTPFAKLSNDVLYVILEVLRRPKCLQPTTEACAVGELANCLPGTEAKLLTKIEVKTTDQQNSVSRIYTLDLHYSRLVLSQAPIAQNRLLVADLVGFYSSIKLETYQVEY